MRMRGHTKQYLRDAWSQGNDNQIDMVDSRMYLVSPLGLAPELFKAIVSLYREECSPEARIGDHVT
jgi:hypothetical protein